MTRSGQTLPPTTHAADDAQSWAMVPLFTIVLAAVALADEHITTAKLGGLGVGFIGVIVLASPNLSAAGTDEDAAAAVAGMVAVAAAGVFYAIASVYVRRRITGMTIVEQPDGSTRAPLPVEIALGTTATALVMVTALAVIFERRAGGLTTVPQTTGSWVGLIWRGRWAPASRTSSSIGSSRAGGPRARRS